MYRRLKSIDPDLFRCDRRPSRTSLFTNPSDEVESLVNQYNTYIAVVLEKNAPLLKKIVKIRTENPWMTDEIQLARMHSRQLKKKMAVKGAGN